MMKIKFYSGNSALHDNRETAPLNPQSFLFLLAEFFFPRSFEMQPSNIHCPPQELFSIWLTEHQLAPWPLPKNSPNGSKRMSPKQVQPIIEQFSFFSSDKGRPQMLSWGRSTLRSCTSFFGNLPMFLFWHHSSRCWLTPSCLCLLVLLSLPPEASHLSS